MAQWESQGAGEVGEEEESERDWKGGNSMQHHVLHSGIHVTSPLS